VIFTLVYTRLLFFATGAVGSLTKSAWIGTIDTAFVFFAPLFKYKLT